MSADWVLLSVVVFIDLDDFEQVNDSLGHAGGEPVFQVVAQRLNGAPRQADTVAHAGGDEFVALIEKLDDRQAGHRNGRQSAFPVSAQFCVDAPVPSRGDSGAACS